MSKKGTIEVFQSKITRNDRFAQMSHQEKVIEQKKKEIQARLEQKQKGQVTFISDPKVATTNSKPKSPAKSCDKKHGFNMFSNDGSFLDQFKQLKDKKSEHKSKLYKGKEGHDKSFSDDRSKTSRWSQTRGSQSPKDVRATKPRTSRFSDKINFEPKINITTTYSNLISQPNFDPISPQNVTGQPLLKNMIPPPGVVYPTPQTSESVIVAPPVLLNMPPPQLVQNSITAPIGVSTTTPLLSATQNVGNIITPTTVLTTVTLPPPTALPSQNASVLQETTVTGSVIGVPPPCVPSIELASIPPPNPIQVHNIPQPEPINTLTIPPPAPIQVQNIPPPSPIQLNEIPNPKPLDILNIPTPNDSCVEKNISNPDFLKNIPPPNKSVPPPTLSESTVTVNMSIPPPPSAEVTVGPPVPTCLPPPNIIPPTSMPPPPQTLPPQSQNIAVQNVPPPPPQSILVQTIPPPQAIQQMAVQSLAPPPPPPPLPQTTQNLIALNQNPGNISVSTAISLTVPIQNQLPVTPVGVPPPPVTVSNTIPSLMAQPVLPPPGMGIAPPININCPPPLIQNTVACSGIQAPPPTFVNQPPPMTSQMPPMNVPPPTALSIGQAASVVSTFRDMNADWHKSKKEKLFNIMYDIENTIESYRFLFHKESAAYRQYEQLVEQFKMELVKGDDQKKDENFYKPEDTYEPESLEDDDSDKYRSQHEEGRDERLFKRKRKSRWGDKDTSVPPPILIVNTPPSSIPTASTGGVMLSKITRNDPALIQYAINTFGSTNISEEDWKKAEDHFKINVLYQEMVRKRQEVENLKLSGKNKYEYDSDEEIDGGTWEHKLREKEMIATQQWATELNRQAEGKHHIGDFLPPEELQKFLEKSNAVKEGRQPSLSDYKEFKLKEDNIGFKMLQKLGWSEGQGLGSNGSGIVEPVNKSALRDQNQGLGLEQPDQIGNADDEYESYRKRMMLAYRFRPNPLNNPRRPYY
ncbi:arginine/serine rich splicing factor sf4/14 [Holotrichia oblita]|uniref:Arginine/serine rich splicing factor sf4/14 n=1 Tax=Holotrichia oblita TaxID=644536 RepID=A0ACB9SY25_HOLOL|nr:arginine/serine rich splicing factor sf4/14 [Holotrichia oblita]